MCRNIITYFFHMDYIFPYKHMNKRCAFYSSICHSARGQTLINQGCIKSCIIHEECLLKNPYLPRVLFFDVFRKEVLCKLKMYGAYIYVSLFKIYLGGGPYPCSASKYASLFGMQTTIEGKP